MYIVQSTRYAEMVLGLAVRVEFRVKKMSDGFSSNIFDEQDEYLFHPSHLEASDFEIRRWAIIEISRLRLREYEKQIIDVVKSPETEQSRKEHLRRHAVRALGSLQSSTAIPVLTEIIQHEDGLIVGDAIQSLGKIGFHDHLALIEPFVHSPNDWISQQARYAIKQLRSRGSDRPNRTTQ